MPPSAMCESTRYRPSSTRPTSSDESVTLDVMAASLRTPSPWIVQAGPDLEWSL